MMCARMCTSHARKRYIYLSLYASMSFYTYMQMCMSLHIDEYIHTHTAGVSGVRPRVPASDGHGGQKHLRRLKLDGIRLLSPLCNTRAINRTSNA